MSLEFDNERFEKTSAEQAANYRKWNSLRQQVLDVRGDIDETQRAMDKKNSIAVTIKEKEELTKYFWKLSAEQSENYSKLHSLLRQLSDVEADFDKTRQELTDQYKSIHPDKEGWSYWRCLCKLIVVWGAYKLVKKI